MARTMTSERAIARIFFIFFSSRKICDAAPPVRRGHRQVYYSNLSRRVQLYFTLFVECVRNAPVIFGDLFYRFVNDGNDS